MGSRSGAGSDRLANAVTMNSLLTPEQCTKYQDTGLIRRVLGDAKTIAMVGLSPNSQRPSYFVASYLRYEGYRVIPVNPRATEILGETAYPDLKSIDIEKTGPIDIVNVFRRPEDCPEIARQAITIGAKALWIQLRVVNQEAAQIAEDAGLDVVMDRCVKIEHGRYNGSLHWVGMNTEIVTARKARRWF